MCLAYSPSFSLSPRGTSGWRVGEGGVRASLGDAPPLPGPLLPWGRRGRRDNSESLNTYSGKAGGLKILNGSKPYRPAGIGRAPKRRHSRCAVRWFLSPHPSPLPWGPWGEGAPFSPRRTIQTRRLSTARCALSPLLEGPEGEGQGEGKRRELPSRVSDHSRNCRTGRVLRQSWRFPEMTMNISSTIRFFPSGPRQLREENPCWFAALVGGVLLTGAVCQVRGA